METVYIVGAVRTAIGKYGGSLKTVPAHTLAAEVMKEAVKRAGIQPDIIDEVILGRSPSEHRGIKYCTICSSRSRFPGDDSRLHSQQALCLFHAGSEFRMPGDLARRSRLHRCRRN